MSKTLADVMTALPPERRRRVDARAKELLAQISRLDSSNGGTLIEEALQAARDGDHEAAVKMLSLVAQSAGLE